MRPKPVDSEQFQVEPDPEVEGGFVVTGARPERWIRQTDFTNDEAVGYLADRLARLGVEAQLAAHGAQPGAPVTIGDVTFDWEPTTLAGVDIVPDRARHRPAAGPAAIGSGPPNARPCTGCAAGWTSRATRWTRPTAASGPRREQAAGEPARDVVSEACRATIGADVGAPDGGA